MAQAPNSKVLVFLILKVCATTIFYQIPEICTKRRCQIERIPDHQELRRLLPVQFLEKPCDIILNIHNYFLCHNLSGFLTIIGTAKLRSFALTCKFRKKIFRIPRKLLFLRPENLEFMLAIISQMAALFILILVGYGAAKLKIIDGRFSQQLSVFVINISSPCLIVSSVMGDISPDKDLILPVLAIGCVTYAFFVAVAMLLSRIITKNKDMQGIYGFMLTFGNVGFIGYPIVASIFGKYAIFYASLLNIPFTLLAFSLGKKMIQGGPGGLKLDWKILVSPAMIACYLSTLIVVFDIKGLPNLVTTPITLLGNITVPAALLIIGTSMAQMDLRRIFSGKLVWGISVLRLLVLPIVIYYFTRLIGFSGDILGINTVLAAMPVGTYGAMFCLQYGKDETVMVQGILISTLLSILSIPLITQIL